MPPNSEYRPRLSIDISEAQASGLNKHLDYGMKKMVFGVIIDDLLRLFDKHGAGQIIGLFVERSISLKETSQLHTKE